MRGKLKLFTGKQSLDLKAIGTARRARWRPVPVVRREGAKVEHKGA